jgi:nitroreductase
MGEAIRFRSAGRKSMKVSEAVVTRRSMRAFKPQMPPREDIEWIVKTASRAASNGNVQPWKLHITTGAARDRLCAALQTAVDTNDAGPGAEYDVYPRQFFEPYDARRKLVGKQLYGIQGIPRGDAAGMLRQFKKNYDFFDAPVGMILCIDRRMGDGQWIDSGIFLDHLMLLAREKGLHTCPQAAFSRYQHVVRRELNIPEEDVVLCGLALGYADENDPPNNLYTERAPPEDFTVWHET